MQNQIGAIVLGSLSALFAGYSMWELVNAYRPTDLKAWGGRAAIAIGSVFVAAIFALMTTQILTASASVN